MADSIKLQVFSEIGRLREVMIHRPGLEVDNMPPLLMEELLFDDILFGPAARAEHDLFTDVLRKFGVRTWDFEDLLRDSLKEDAQSTQHLVEILIERERLSTSIKNVLLDMSPEQLTLALIHGIKSSSEKMAPGNFFELNPLPNLLMSRDPQVVLGNGVIIGSMKRSAREREAILSKFIYSTHPALKNNHLHFDFHSSGKTTTLPQFGNLSLEGGDVLIFNEGVVVVGVSERTMEQSIDLLADTLRKLDRFKTMIMVRMPGSRSQMHLDTIMTRISKDECLVYPPMLQEGFAETLSVCSIDLARNKKDYGKRHLSFFQACKSAGLKLDAIPCGEENNYIQQTREQWTDGANSFSLAPGLIVLYQRNAATIEELSKRGYQSLSATDFIARSDEIEKEVKSGSKYVICIPSSELSRARGGPRCMTMPLVREPV